MVNQQPNFVLTPNIGFGKITSAQVPRDGSDTGTTLCFTAGPNGSRVDRIIYYSSQATVTTNSTSLLRLYIGDRYNSYTNHINYRLFREFNMTSVAGSNTAIGFNTILDIGGGLFLSPYQTLGAAMSIYNGVADNIDVIVEGVDY